VVQISTALTYGGMLLESNIILQWRFRNLYCFEIVFLGHFQPNLDV